MAPTQIQHIGPYQIRAEIRRDLFSVTYQAFDTSNKQELTLRVLNPELASDPLIAGRFMRAGQETVALQHDNIVQVYGAGELDGYSYIIGELVNGKTLLSLLIQRNKLLSHNEVISIVQQIATALDHAHEHGFLHLDLNFRHILITEAGQALLLDFGFDELRRYVDTSNTNAGNSTDVSVFTAPEQVRGDYNLDYRADIYSLGVLVYAMLVGKLPFEASEAAALQRQILEQAPPSADSINPRIPTPVVNMLNKVLAKEPEQRYSSANEFARGLTQGLLWAANNDELSEFPPDDENDPPDKQPFRRGCLISAVSLALLLLTVLAFAAFYARPTLINRLAVLGFGNGSDGAITTTTITSTTSMATPIQPVLAITTPPTSTRAIAQLDALSVTVASTLESTPPTAPIAESNSLLTPTLPSGAPSATAVETPATLQAAAGQATVTTLPSTPTETTAQTLAPPTNTHTPLPTVTPKPTETSTPASIATASVNLVLTPTVATVAPAQAAVGAAAQVTATQNVTQTTDALITATNTTTPTPTATVAPTTPPAPTVTPTSTATATPPATATVLPTSTTAPTATATFTPEPTMTATVIVTPTHTPAPTATVMPTDTATIQPTATATLLPTNTHTPVPTVIATFTPSATNTSIPTATSTPIDTATPVPTVTPPATATATATVTNTSLPTSTSTSTSTATATAVPTVTSTATAMPTVTPTETATVTNTALPTSTSTAVPTATFTPTVTDTATLTNTATPTSLPTATLTPTLLPTPLPTPIPLSFDSTSLRKPLTDGTARMQGVGEPGSTVQVLVDGAVAGTTIVRANGAWALTVALGNPGDYRINVRAVKANGTVVQSNTRAVTVIVPTPAPLPTPTVTIGTVQLSGPGDGAAGTGQINFQWSANFKPDAGLAFELVFWKEGQNPIASGFGLAAPTTGTKATVNLSTLDDKLGDLLEPGNYKWGILLVRVSPYQRVQFMGQARTFRFDRSGNNSGGGSGSSSGGGQNSGE